MLHLDDIAEGRGQKVSYYAFNLIYLPAGSLSLVIGHLQRVNDIASYLGKFNLFSVRRRICGAFLLKIISVRRTSS